MATDDIEMAIQRAAEKSRPPRKESLTSKVLKSWEAIAQYRANGGTVRALAAEMGIDEKQLSQAIFQAKKQIEKRGVNVTQNQKTATKNGGHNSDKTIAASSQAITQNNDIKKPQQSENKNSLLESLDEQRKASEAKQFKHDPTGATQRGNKDNE
jgi:transposase-like protein